MRAPLSRRAVLRGLGTAIALPALECMLPSRAEAAVDPVPRRTVVVMVPNGMWMPAWTPGGTGAAWTASPSLAPLERHRTELSILSGVRNGPLGTGDPHFAASAGLLTGRRVDVGFADDLGEGASVDQVLASVEGRHTALPSLELSSDAPVLCDAGVGRGLGGSCTFMWTVSWAGPTSPVPRENQPRRVFERLFGAGDAAETAAQRARRQHLGQSVLDFVLGDIARLQRRLGAGDRQRLDAWLTGVEELEARLWRAPSPPDPGCELARAELEARWDLGSQPTIVEHVDQMSDLISLALQCDRTRVVTWMIGNVRSDRPYPHLGVPESHHWCSHHGYQQALIDKIVTIGIWEVEVYAALLDRLRAVQDVDGTSLLDNSAVVFLSPFSDPHEHDPRNIPLVVAGRLRGTLAPKGHVRAATDTPLARLHLDLLQKHGVAVDTFGDHGTSPLGLLDP